MGADSIDSKEGREKLSEIIQDKRKELKRFKEGFRLSIKRNIENRIITDIEAAKLITELESIKF